jgi:SAM-dependent methyltransferase
MGSAALQGRLWSASPEDWAEITEPLMRPVHQAAVDALSPLSGLSLLDAGCGSGQLLRLAAAGGARVSGLDAAAALLGWPAVCCPARTCAPATSQSCPTTTPGSTW